MATGGDFIKDIVSSTAATVIRITIISASQHFSRTVVVTDAGSPFQYELGFFGFDDVGVIQGKRSFTETILGKVHDKLGSKDQTISIRVKRTLIRLQSDAFFSPSKYMIPTAELRRHEDVRKRWVDP